MSDEIEQRLAAAARAAREHDLDHQAAQAARAADQRINFTERAVAYAR